MRCLKPILRQMIFRPIRIAAIDDQRTWKAYEIYIAALHLAKKIEQTTDRPHVGFILPTSGLSPVAIIATWLLGRTVVPLNYLLKQDDLEYVIRDAEIDTIITVGPMLKHIGELPSDVKQIRLDEMKFKGMPPLRRMKRRPDDHLAALLYTSGTSGRPKGVMLSSGNLASNVEQCVEWSGFNRDDVMLGVLPQFHSFGLTVLTLMPFSVGCNVVYTARFMPKKILQLMSDHRPTVFIAIPSMFNALLHTKSSTAEHFSSLRCIVSGGEPLPQAVFDGFQERFDITINEGYGLTETAPVTNWCRPHEHKPKSVGRALPGVEHKIVDKEGTRLGLNTDGEVCMRGPNIMQGYYKLDEETSKVFDDEGYFKTGDMGRIDDDGHLYITGRFKEMLIIGGENVFPREIEEVLNAHESVKDSAVIGMQDDSRGEVALAFIELAEDAEFVETDLRSHCREALPQYKVPRGIRVIEALPRNPTGKILRRELSIDTPSIANAEQSSA